MKKCYYCGDKIWDFDETKTRMDRDEKELLYHKGCYEIYLEEIMEKVRDVSDDQASQYKN